MNQRKSMTTSRILCKVYLIFRPKEFNPVNEQLTKNLNELLDKGSLDTSKNRTKFSEIPNGSKDEVLDLINSVMNNIKRLSKDRDWFQSYYSTVSGTIGIGNYTHYALEKMGKTSSIITTAAKAGNSSNKNEMFNKINAQIEEFELNPNTEANEVKPLQATTNKELAKAVTLGERHSHRNNFNNVEDVDIVIDDQFDQVNH